MAERDARPGQAGLEVVQQEAIVGGEIVEPVRVALQPVGQ